MFHLHPPLRRPRFLAGTVMILLAAALSGCLAAAASAAPASEAASGAGACAERTLLPAYFYPGPAWSTALATTSAASTIIVNPDSGPGAAFDANYAAVVASARSKGARLFGYVDTHYAATALSTVQAQVQDYRSWYGIDNIFFDDVSSSASALGYYQSASQIVRTADASASVILNPGDYPSTRYATLGDILVVFEGTYQALQTTVPPTWISRYPRTMFATLVNDVPPTALDRAISLASADHSGYVYASPNTVSTTLYEQVPSYWSTELSDIAATCPPGGAATGTPPGSSAGARLLAGGHRLGFAARP